MRSRLVTIVALVIGAVAVFLAGSRLIPHSSQPPVAKASLPASAASYLGVYEVGSPPAYQPIANFAQAVGGQPNLVGYYSGWAEPFATSFAEAIHREGVIPFVQIDPTFASVSGIAAGDYDAYLNSYAGSVRDFGHAVVIGFGHEMNGPWYPWGYGHVAPSTFIAAWRHIVTLFRNEGAKNVTWLWTVNQERYNTGPVAAWWPGAAYVTWVGIDGYYFRPSDTFGSVFGRTIDQVRALTDKPVLLSETGVGPESGQFVKIGDLFAGMHQYKALGLVWFDKDLANGPLRGPLYQDWRIEDSQSALAAFRLGISELTLARP